MLHTQEMVAFESLDKGRDLASLDSPGTWICDADHGPRSAPFVRERKTQLYKKLEGGEWRRKFMNVKLREERKRGRNYRC